METPPHRWCPACLAIGAAAGNRALVAVRQHPLARRHSALKSQPRKSKGPGAFAHSRPAPFQQRTNTSWRSTRSQPAVSRRLFRCLRAHLLRSPWTVKSSADTLACFWTTGGQTPPAENLGSPTPLFVSCQMTSSRCRVVLTHSAVPFVVVFWSRVFMGKQRTLPPVGKQGWKTIPLNLASPAYRGSIRIRFGFMTQTGR